MSQRAAKFVSAIFASLLGTAFATVSHGAPEAAGGCLAAPKGALPQGGHWYYRIDRATKRHCWYVGDEKEKLSRAAPDNSKRPDDSVSGPASPPKDAVAQRSIADARAEFPMPQTRVEPDPSAFAGQRAPAAVADPARFENNQRANAGDAEAGRTVFASRWPEPAGSSSSAGPAPLTASSQVIARSSSEAAPPPIAPAVTLAAADAASVRPSGSIQQLLIVIVGALALAGLIASAIFRLGAARQSVRVDRRVNWNSGRTNRPSLADEARAANDDRIAQMLARLARSTAAN